MEAKTKWYVGTMNDALFVINEPPRPAPVDHHNDTLKTKIIAKVSEPHQEGWTQEEYQAHANLLAAAPDLLEALKECFAIVRLQNGNLHADTNEIQDRALSAIAKAEGRCGFLINSAL